MIETAKMSERGQIIIPKEIRDCIRATADTIFAVSTLDESTVVMKKLDTKSLSAEFKRLRSKTQKVSSKKVEAEINAARK